jgi:cellulose synthase/poly-beta-1,6-N-acetylglucosamine synthase-like glycosyltransferase
LELIVWFCILLVVYSYLLYPLLLWVISGWAKCPEAPPTPDVLPRVAVLIAAYNEADCIRARIENLLSLNYPALQILVGDDGSSDETVSILKSISSDQLRCELFPGNRGKSAVLNDLVASSDAEVLVFTDANTKFHDDALLHLVRHLEDNTIGAVCG